MEALELSQGFYRLYEQKVEHAVASGNKIKTRMHLKNLISTIEYSFETLFPYENYSRCYDVAEEITDFFQREITPPNVIAKEIANTNNGMMNPPNYLVRKLGIELENLITATSKHSFSYISAADLNVAANASASG